MISTNFYPDITYDNERNGKWLHRISQRTDYSAFLIIQSI